MADDDGGGGASRSTDPAAGTSSATDVSLREFFSALLAYDQARNKDYRDAQARFEEERDRRYSEVNIEKEKALKIKETADLAALGLAREIQTYKDEKANELREQINSERGLYVTREEYATSHMALTDKLETATAPLASFVASQQGRRDGIGSSAATISATLFLAVAILSAVLIYIHK